MSDSAPDSSDVVRLPDLVEKLRAENQQLATALEFHERDRQLLAFEIHDGIVQDMAAAVMFLEAAGGRATFTSQDLATYEKGLQTLRGAIQESRRLIQGLIPVALDERGLAASLERVVERFRDDCGLEIDFTSHLGPLSLPPPVEMTVLRIVQESLHNVWKHSQSPCTEVKLELKDAVLIITVRDQGVGFDPAQVKPSRYGLVGIKERARLFGGAATITSVPGQGTTVRVELPLSAEG